MQIIRKQIDDNQKHIRNVRIKVISESTGAEIATISISDFNDNAELLLNSIKVVKKQKTEHLKLQHLKDLSANLNVILQKQNRQI